MTSRPSLYSHLFIALAAVSSFLTHDAAHAMGSINIDLQIVATDTRPAEPNSNEREERGEQTSIHLSASNITEIDVGETAKINGFIAPNPGKVSVDLTVVSPDGTPLPSVVINTQADGKFTYEFVAEQSGSYAASASWGGDMVYQGTSAELEVPVQQPTGMFVVLVDGKDQYEWNARKTVANYAVTSLVGGGVSPSRIKYLTPDHGTDNASILSTDLSTKDNFIDAIENWAPTLVDINELGSAAHTPLTVIFVGRGLEDYIYTNENEVMSSSELNTTLDNYLTNVQARYDTGVTAPSVVPVNVVIEAAKSGSFIDELTAPARYIFTSTDHELDPDGKSNLGQGGVLSFTYQFMSQLAANQTLSQAFTTARITMTSVYTDQEPQLEASGNTTPNEDADQLAVSGIYLETHATSNLPPSIVGVGASPTITVQSGTTTLSALVTDPEDDNLEVRATIIPPGSAVMSTFVQTFSQSATDVYEVDVTGLTAPGVYQVIYTATDSRGNLSNIKTGTITVVD